MIHIVALSGGKDSTAMALELVERQPHIEFEFVCTPTGDELPAMIAHWAWLRVTLGNLTMLDPVGGGLVSLARDQAFLPNTKSRWCTRMLKIQPYQAYLVRLRSQGARIVSYVGLRADEESRQGMYGAGADEYRFPLREWGWNLADVQESLRRRNVSIPERTDCAICPYQQLYEWYLLWRDHPDMYAAGVKLESDVSTARGKLYTIRSASRDTWPAGLRTLGAEFERGRVPRDNRARRNERCRVCSL